MGQTQSETDLQTGISLLFGVVAVLAAVATAATAYSAEVQASDTMQLYSGIALTIALVAGGLTVAAFHIFD